MFVCIKIVIINTAQLFNREHHLHFQSPEFKLVIPRVKTVHSMKGKFHEKSEMQRLTVNIARVQV